MNKAYIKNLEEQKLHIQRELDRKEIEINDLNASLNEKIDEIDNLQIEKKSLQDELVNWYRTNHFIVSIIYFFESSHRWKRKMQQTNRFQKTSPLKSYEVH